MPPQSYSYRTTAPSPSLPSAPSPSLPYPLSLCHRRWFVAAPSPSPRPLRLRRRRCVARRHRFHEIASLPSPGTTGDVVRLSRRRALSQPSSRIRWPQAVARYHSRTGASKPGPPPPSVRVSPPARPHLGTDFSPFLAAPCLRRQIALTKTFIFSE